MIKDNWEEKQVDLDAKMLCKIIFNKETPNYLPLEHEKDADVNALYSTLDKLLLENRCAEAEDLLFDSLVISNFRYLELAIDFYVKLNHKSDEELEAGDFSREEVEQGLSDIVKRFNVNIPLHMSLT